MEITRFFPFSLKKQKSSFAYGGLLVTITIAAAIEVIDQILHIHLYNPGPLLLIAIAYSAYSGGFLFGFISAAISALYSTYYFSQGATWRSSNPRDVAELIMLIGTGFVIAALIGLLKWRNEQILTEQITEEYDRQQQKYFGIFTNAIPHLLWTADPEGSVLYYNRHWYQYTGLSPKESLGAAGMSAIHPDDLPRARVAWERSRNTGVTYEVEYRLRAASGQYHWFLVRGEAIRDEHGNIFKWFASATDIDGIKDVQEQLCESEQRFKVIADSSPILIWMTNALDECEYFNTAWLTFTGRTLEQEKQNAWKAGLHPDDFTEADLVYRSSLSKRQSFAINYRLRRHDGQYRWILDTAIPRFTPDGNFLGYMGSCLDITEVKEAKDIVEKSKNQLETILNNIPNGISLHDGNGALIYANRAILQAMGISNLQNLLKMEDHHFDEFMVLEDEAGQRLLFEELPSHRARRDHSYDTRIIKFHINKLNKDYWVHVSSTPIFGGDGSVTMVVNVYQDVTNEKNTEEHLRQAAQRQSFLAEAGTALSASLDYTEALKNVASLLVSRIADVAVIDILESDNTAKRVVVDYKGSLPGDKPFAGNDSWFVHKETKYGISAVLRTGQSEFLPELAEERLAQVFDSGKLFNILKNFEVISILTVPLKVLDKTIGTITMAATKNSPVFTQEDLSLAEELARRASLAIQNAWLYAETQEMAQREHEQAMLVDTLLNNAPIGFAMVNCGMELVRANRIVAELHNEPLETLYGKKVSQLMPGLGEQFEVNVARVLESGQPVVGVEINMPAKEQLPSRSWITSYYPVYTKDQGLLGVGIMMVDTTQQRAAEREIHFRAFHDTLTGLPNRKALEEKLMAMFHKAKYRNGKFAVMFLDLDRLKNINDTLGHDFGDQVLKEVGSRLARVLRAEDLVARWGGDEFILVMGEIDTVQEVPKLAERILREIEPHMRIGGHTIHVTGSIGIAMFPQDGEDIATLKKNADAALYRAKEAGKNRFLFYHQAMNFQASERLVFENSLRQALKNKEFQLYYQPVLDLKTGNIMSVETLLRWRHPVMGLLSPLKFVPLAEEIGLIVPLGKWVIETALSDARWWNEQGYELPVAVNVSPRQFADERFVGDVLALLRDSELPEDLVEFEITESLAMENLEHTRNILRILSEHGLNITVDDFGTGYSSLSYLKRFPIQKLKIDKSFVRHCITDEHDTSIIKAIISMAKSLHLKVVAEGVDSEMQLGLLRQLGCDGAQGYRISRPLSKPELIEFLEKHSPVLVSLPETKKAPQNIGESGDSAASTIA